LNEVYLDLLRRYYGHEEGVCNIDELFQVEWAFIPHFHYHFYVYSYATSYVAATAFQKQILDGTNGGMERYKEKLLKAGSIETPVQILRSAGVDLTTAKPYEDFVLAMNAIMDEFEAILDRLENSQQQN
jgi:oligoendopeptidase F